MSRRGSAAVVVVLLASLAPPPLTAIPNFAAGRQAGGLMVYPDDRRHGLYYYGPGELGLAVDGAGRPDLHFLQSRYTGTAAARDQGTFAFRSVLTLRVRQLGVGPQELDGVRRSLRLVRGNELRPLPIARLEAVLGYAPVRAPVSAAAALPGDDTATGADQAAAPAAGEEQRTIAGGHFESDGEVDGPVWLERTYVLSLDAEESQLLWDALQRDRLVLSIGYAFFAAGRNEVPGAMASVGGGTLGDELRRTVAEAIAPAQGAEGDDAPPPVLVRAGASSITVDAARWPDLFRRVDINDRLPPGYAGLDVYCYDFRDGLRQDLYEKQVEVTAEAVGGQPVTLLAAFHQSQPDLYALSLRFPVAVRLDRPYRYRVSEVRRDGAAHPGPWQQGKGWAGILDVTTTGSPTTGAAALE